VPTITIGEWFALPNRLASGVEHGREEKDDDGQTDGDSQVIEAKHRSPREKSRSSFPNNFGAESSSRRIE
jgi:hypothetical protein